MRNLYLKLTLISMIIFSVGGVSASNNTAHISTPSAKSRVAKKTESVFQPDRQQALDKAKNAMAMLEADAPIYDDKWNIPAEPHQEAAVNRLQELVKKGKALGEEGLLSQSMLQPESKLSVNASNLEPQKGSWCLQSNNSLKDNLMRWSTKAGWKLEWLSEFDFPISAPFCLSGEYMEALQTLVKSYSQTTNPLTLDLYPSQSVAVFTQAK
jgi:hypothetical protein